MRYVVLLRGINVGGNKKVGMADLRAALGGAGLEGAQTLLQSGNVIVDSNADVEALTAIVEATIDAEFGFPVVAIVRTGDEFVDLLGSHPFSEDQIEDPRFAHVGFCRDEPGSDGFSDLMAEHEGTEELMLGDREVFIYYPDGSGRSKITNSVLESHLKTRITSRNWNTILKISDRLDTP